MGAKKILYIALDVDEDKDRIKHFDKLSDTKDGNIGAIRKLIDKDMETKKK